MSDGRSSLSAVLPESGKEPPPSPLPAPKHQQPLQDDKREIFRAAADAQSIASMELSFHPDYAAQVQDELTGVPR